MSVSDAVLYLQMTKIPAELKDSNEKNRKNAFHV